jgi:hypothetical protein
MDFGKSNVMSSAVDYAGPAEAWKDNRLTVLGRPRRLVRAADRPNVSKYFSGRALAQKL